ncbi:MBL fold metallo-hydrolase [Azohydromonas sediminis]|uniref:MBL fold metallo-hydrolase n=1 Tax=Azohydromonas sediminis TaxID=2259674 RepID=UPI000E6508F1|nr:MBL fold metallo-hydrolase [Azohydromonas sediminis]
MAHPTSTELHHPFGHALPPPGGTLEVAPGVRWVRMGLPFALDHVNLWLLRDRDDDGRDGWTVVDCGIANDATRAAWEQVFAAGLDALPVLRVIATHMHPDHLGLAHWLTERWRCRLWISATDYHVARVASQATTGGGGGDEVAAFFAEHGLTDAESVAKVRARAGYYRSLVPQVPRQFRRLMDGQVLRIGAHAWRCIAGYGHAPEHVALHCEALGVLISGDMVLPRISTNVSVYDTEPEADPLPLYLASLDRLRALPPSTLVLPSHGRPFVGLHARIAQLHAHHDARLAETLAACRAQPTSAQALVPVLFRRELDLHQTTFAMGEAIAHLHALWHTGRLERRRGDDGVWRFTAT